MRVLSTGFVRLAACMALFVCVGCGGRINRGGMLRGKVTIDGAPVTAGDVLFVSDDDQLTAIGALKGDGTYLVKEPPLGNVKIAVQTTKYRDRGRPAANSEKSGPTHKDAGSPGMILPDSSHRGLVYKSTPKKYENADSSGLHYVVERGDAIHDIELTDK
jgi:hypothetical protein